MMCLSLPKVFDAGSNHGETNYNEIKTYQPALERDEVVTSFIILQEEPPDYTKNPTTVATKETELSKSSAQVSPLPQFVSKSVIVNFLSLEEPKENLVSIGTNKNQITSIKTSVNEKLDEVVKTDSCSSVLNNSMTVIMHLPLVESVENISGMEKKQQEHNTQRLNVDITCEKGDFTKTNALQPKDVSQQPWRGVIASLLIKEEPPDPRIKLHPNSNDNIARGKLLNSHFYENANLLYLCAGKEVSWTKPFQGGGYDADIQPAIPPGDDPPAMKAHGIATAFGMDCTGCTAGLDPRPIGNSGSILKVRTVAPKLLQTQVMMRWIKTSSRTVLFFLYCGFIPIGFPGKVLTRQQLVGAQELKANRSSSSTTWFTFSSHLESTSKWNHSNRSSDERDVDFTNRVFSNLPDLDIHAQIRGLRLNQEELSYKPTWSRILIHQGRTESWFHLISGSDFGAMYFTTQWTCFGLKPATRPNIVLPSPTQQLSRPRTTWRILMGLSRIQQAKDPTNWPLDHQDGPNILKRVDLIPFMATPRSDRSKSSSTRVWRPGDILRHLRSFLEASLHDLRCTTPHLIKWIKFELHLPYLESHGIKLQRLIAFKCYDLDGLHEDQNVPEKLTYPLKPSRYKGDITHSSFG